MGLAMEWQMIGTVIRRDKIEGAREMKGKSAAMKSSSI